MHSHMTNLTPRLLLCTAITLIGIGLQTAQVKAENPLLTESTLQYQYPRFDLIKSTDFAPAFKISMERHSKEIEAIANNPESPTFENTIIAQEKAGKDFNRVSTTFFNLSGANTDPIIDETEKDVASKISAHQDSIYLNKALYARVHSLYENRFKLNLDAESIRLVERYEQDFVRAGAKLNDAQQEKIKQINAELATLTAQFGQNVLKEKNASEIILDSAAELDGLSSDQIASAAAFAKEEGHPGKYIVHILNTTGQPFLSQLKNRSTRERLMKASLARGTRGGAFDNQKTLVRIVELRAEQAELLGYPSHAAYKIETETAKTVDAVNKLLAQLAPPAVANAKKEAAELQKMIDSEHGNFQLAAWDWAYYSEKVRKAKYAFDESQLKPYFELNHVLTDGVFYAAHELYGLSFVERHDLPVYNPDVRVFEVFDKDGTSLALFMEDFYSRASKQGGAWMNEYTTQSFLLNTHPVVANHHNIPKPAAGQPTLLTFDEVTTLFHEFGHALHGMFSHVKYPTFAGTNVPRDFVEFPSQVNEMWAAWPQVVSHYAKHYQTGQPIPQALLAKMLATQKFNQGFATTEYLSASLIDQAWHQRKAGDVPTDVPAFEAESLKKVGLDFAAVPPRYRSTYFAHAFSNGYSAGYYSYIWADVLVADSIEWFTTHGGLLRSSGDHFREALLSQGDSKDPMDLFKNFTGSGPDVVPLLKKRGLLQQKPVSINDQIGTKTPHYGTWGYDSTGQDKSVQPGTDFFNFANGTWYKNETIPSDRTRYGNFDKLTILSENRTRKIIEDAAAHPTTPATQRIAAAYNSFMNEERANKLGAAPLAQDLATIRSEKTYDDVAAVMGASKFRIPNTLYHVMISADAKSPKKYTVLIAPGGLGLPDRDYYLEKSLAPKKAQYQAYVKQLLELIKWDNPDASAAQVVTFETKIAEASWTRAQMREREKTYNPMTVAELQAYAPGFNFRALLDNSKLTATNRLIVTTNTAFPKISAIFAQTPIATIQAWQAFHLADETASILSSDFVNAEFNFREKALAGQPEMKPRWKRGVALVNGILGEQVGEAYVAQYFPEESKKRMDALVHDLITVMHHRIQNLDWMSPQTKAKALEKLSKFTIKIGYPTKWKDYSSLKLSTEDIYENFVQNDSFEWNYRLARINEPVDKLEWGMTPQTVNAYYNSINNEIVFPAAILQPPFFDINADMAINYGGIGGVIGHEMTHGFDDQGRKSDGDGVLNDWWTKEDAERFKAQADRLAAQYSQFEPVKGYFVNGRLTLGENIADLGGLLLALDAYHASLNGKPAPVIDGLTGDQRVFLGWAQVWRDKVRDDASIVRIKSDPHSPAHFRVNGPMRNNPGWYEAFGISPSDPMYIAPENRVHIW